jgi:hypothetical protein
MLGFAAELSIKEPGKLKSAAHESLADSANERSESSNPANGVVE